MGNLFVSKHPLVAHKLSIMRDKNTSNDVFRAMLYEISSLMCYEVTRDLLTDDYELETPLQRTIGKKLADKIVVVPILRAGLGMIDGFLKLIPNISVGHIGLYRDHETHLPIKYYCNLPRHAPKSEIIVVDPMLATGGSAADAIDMLKSEGCERIRFLCLVSAPEGIELLQKRHPDVDIYTCALDEKLNENAYILPGLGDAGDRIFGTD
ncbi:MAG: uracil phosphoribosyltransferase [Clostridia bacterium]|nr:uracil phosphoribosyltransferase [Clostridia bacterium]